MKFLHGLPQLNLGFFLEICEKIFSIISICIVNWYRQSLKSQTDSKLQTAHLLAPFNFFKKLFLKVHYVTFNKMFVSDDTGGLYVNFSMLPHAAACETSGNCIKTHGNNEGQYCWDSFDNIEKENARLPFEFGRRLCFSKSFCSLYHVMPSQLHCSLFCLLLLLMSRFI